MARPNTNDNGSDRLRITDQFRTRHGMAYELRCRGARLTVLIAERTSPTAPGKAAESEWQVDASSTQTPGAEVSQCGATRAEALRRTGAKWALDCATLGLPSFDWTEVATALSAVRAI